MGLRQLLPVTLVVASMLSGEVGGQRIVDQSPNWIGPAMAFYPSTVRIRGDASKVYFVYNTGEKGEITFEQKRDKLELTYRVTLNGQKVMLKKKTYTLGLQNSLDFAIQRSKFLTYIRGVVGKDDEKFSKERNVERKSLEVMTVLFYRSVQRDGVWYAKFAASIYLNRKLEDTLKKEFEMEAGTPDAFLNRLAEFKNLLEVRVQGKVDEKNGPDWQIQVPTTPAPSYTKKYRFKVRKLRDGSFKLYAICYLVNGGKVVKRIGRVYRYVSADDESSRINSFKKTAC